ncbi:unnamed protein product [Arctia plantaginis]|uniref:WD repeat-containing protein 60 n=1 Tax=Arctia plantaginis TaxID=874455 RepID=A0A8S0YW55_ARCPL|nr:unnamed protein product [Arctia plantaginis]
MQTTIKKTIDAKGKREKQPKDDAPKSQDEKLKKTPNSISTPRTYVQKSSTADIYSQNKRSTTHSIKAPKKAVHGTNITSNVSPMRDQLKSSSSSTSVASSVNSSRERNKMAVQKKVDAIINRHSSTKAKDFNVTVNSPVVRRKLNLDKEKSFVKEDSKREKDYSPVVKRKLNLDKEKSFITEDSRREKDNSPAVKKKLNLNKEKNFAKESSNSPVVKRRLDLDKEQKITREDSKIEIKKEKLNSSRSDSQKVMNADVNERKRTKTRTLDESEVKILTPDVVDNNAEMFNLSKKLSAKPKAYYIDFEEDKAIQIEKVPKPKTPSDEEVSYEDDFESYESDFDSYHSSSHSEHNMSCDDTSEQNNSVDESTAFVEQKDVKDEEKMLDSGSFDLRDQRSATKTKPVLDFILETAEGADDKRSSLTDEGFQEMSSSSAVSSIRTVHVDVLDRPLFIDFTKSKENKRKKRFSERLKQRAKDLLSVITLHEMSYNLFEMKPISYDLYMATFGRSNYQQVAVQTFDDGITEEVQTDEIEYSHKWSQHPVEFTKSDICFKDEMDKRKYSKHMEDYLLKFTFLTMQGSTIETNNVINYNESYKTDPLRIYFEQRDGVGPSEMLPYETYKSKLKNNDYNVQRLGKFLKKMENRMCKVLLNNSGNPELSELKISRFSFSKGYVSISTKNITDKSMSFLNDTKISQIYFSETKTNLLMTIHKKTHETDIKKCTICLWDIGVARREPMKILTAIDNVVIGRFRGATDGFFVAALEDGSIHLWDLSEEATWRPDVASEENSKELVEINDGDLTAVERDREWNQRNSHVGFGENTIQCPLQACAFTNSAYNMSDGDVVDRVVGLELTGVQTVNREGPRIIGQIAVLQRTGILTIWSIIQEKSKTVPPDIGKAFWSKMKLEKSETINLLDHIDISVKESQNQIEFNLNAAKKRLQNRKIERNLFKTHVSRPKSAYDIDKPSSAASVKNRKVLPVQENVSKSWESGVVCYDLKVMFWRNSDNYLIAKNCGEVMCCRRTLGVIRINRFCVAADVSSVTCIEVSPQKLPYYLIATDTGTIALCSLVENRVLLTLDCRNISTQEVAKCQSDHKGRYISTVLKKAFTGHDPHFGNKLPISSLSWSRINPCCIFASLDGSIVSWELSHSDIYAKCAYADSAVTCAAGDNTLALVTMEGEVQVHKLTNEHKSKEYLQLFEKYITLL